MSDKIYQLTCAEAKSLEPPYLIRVKCKIVNMKTRDATSEMSRVTGLSSWNSWVICGQSNPPDISLSDWNSIQPQGCQASFLIVSSSNVVPHSGTYSPRDLERFSPVASHKLRTDYSTANHTEIDTDTPRIVMEYRSSTFWVEPQKDGDWVMCIQPSGIWEVNKAVGKSLQLVRTSGKPIRSVLRNDIDKSCRRIFKGAFVFSTFYAI